MRMPYSIRPGAPPRRVRKRGERSLPSRSIPGAALVDAAAVLGVGLQRELGLPLIQQHLVNIDRRAGGHGRMRGAALGASPAPAHDTGRARLVGGPVDRRPALNHIGEIGVAPQVRVVGQRGRRPQPQQRRQAQRPQRGQPARSRPAARLWRPKLGLMLVGVVIDRPIGISQPRRSAMPEHRSGCARS